MSEKLVDLQHGDLRLLHAHAHLPTLPSRGRALRPTHELSPGDGESGVWRKWGFSFEKAFNRSFSTSSYSSSSDVR